MLSESHKKPVWVFVLLLAAPLIAGLSLYIVSGADPLQMDAWRTTWNDEVVYYRAVSQMHQYGTPMGVWGYNEVAAEQLTYGAYNIFTFIPYYLMAFITGTSGHNYFYICNLLLTVLACFLFGIFARPGKKNAVFIFLFFVTYLILGRYIWSGMIESSYNFFMIVFTGIFFRFAGKDSRPGKVQYVLLILLMAAMTFFWSVMRLYLLPLLLIPLYYSLRGRKDGPCKGIRLLLAVIVLAFGVGTVYLYLYFGRHSVAPYFSNATSPTKQLIILLKSGSIPFIMEHVLQTNLDALNKVAESLAQARWIGAVTVVFYAEWILLFIRWIRGLLAKRDKGESFGIFVFLLSGALIYEATVVLYTPVQLHRMLLSVTVAYALVIIMSGELILPICHELVIAGIMAFLVLNRPAGFALPQMNEESITGAGQEAYQAALEDLIPLETDPWDVTIAKEIEGENIAYEFLVPSYAAFNICQDGVLEEKIMNGTLKSRFVILPEDSKLVSLCEETKEDGTSIMEKVWEDFGHVMYRRK